MRLRARADAGRPADDPLAAVAGDEDDAWAWIQNGLDEVFGTVPLGKMVGRLVCIRGLYQGPR